MLQQDCAIRVERSLNIMLYLIQDMNYESADFVDLSDISKEQFYLFTHKKQIIKFCEN